MCPQGLLAGWSLLSPALCFPGQQVRLETQGLQAGVAHVQNIHAGPVQNQSQMGHARSLHWVVQGWGSTLGHLNGPRQTR